MTQIDKKEEDSDSSLDSIEKDELVRKLEKLAMILKIWKSKQGRYTDEIKRLLTINGNMSKCDSIFSRLGISPSINLDKVLDDNYYSVNKQTDKQLEDLQNLSHNYSISQNTS